MTNRKPSKLAALGFAALITVLGYDAYIQTVNYQNIKKNTENISRIEDQVRQDYPTTEQLLEYHDLMFEVNRDWDKIMARVKRLYEDETIDKRADALTYEELDEVNDAINSNPNKRLTLPEDIGKAVVSIGLSDENWMTGNTIRLDGGEDIFG